MSRSARYGTNCVASGFITAETEHSGTLLENGRVHHADAVEGNCVRDGTGTGRAQPHGLTNAQPDERGSITRKRPRSGALVNAFRTPYC